MTDSGIIRARNTRVYVGSTLVALGKNASCSAEAEADKEYSQDSLNPALLEVGNISYKWSIQKLSGNQSWLTSLKAGTKFTMDFLPNETPATTPYKRLINCVCLKVGDSSGISGGIARDVSGEAMDIQDITPPA